MKKYNIAIVGATGMVGQIPGGSGRKAAACVELLPVCISSICGKRVKFMGKEHIINELTETCFDDKEIDIALFSAGASVSRKYAPIAASKGIVVIDNSSAWRMDGEVPRLCRKSIRLIY